MYANFLCVHRLLTEELCLSFETKGRGATFAFSVYHHKNGGIPIPGLVRHAILFPRAMIVLLVLCLVGMLTTARGFRGAASLGGIVSRRYQSSVSAFNNGLSDYSLSEAPAVKVGASTALSFRGDLLVVPFYKPSVSEASEEASAEEQDAALSAGLKSLIPDGLDADVKSMIGEIVESGLFKGDVKATYVTKVFGSGSVKSLALVGLGPNPKKDGPATDLEVKSANRLGEAIMRLSKDTKSRSVGVVAPTGIANAGLTQVFLGMTDGHYADTRYKKVPPGGFPVHPMVDLTILGVSSAVEKDVAVTYSLTKMIGSGVDFARDLVGAPSNSKTPLVIADLARKIASDHNIECTVLGQAECEELGMGAYLGVQQGSKFPPQFVHLAYKPEGGATKKIALVGKGLTFDSGGYNLKAGAGSMIELMKFDMGGCAAVLGTAKAIAQLRPKNVEVHFITALCENMINEEAMRPGDILRASNGKTIEVLNTDAEGRLTLADALVYADKIEGVDTIVDLATLTGACIVGLGDKLAGLYSPDDSLLQELTSAAKRADEGIWGMPLPVEYKEMIKGSLGDLKNIGGRAGGSITAALFLQEFVDPKTKWAHIDMAGPVWDNGTSKPTGYGVKLLVDFLLNAK